MKRERNFRMELNSRGAVAPTVALSLFALIGAAGIAFDYARMASLDTELQNAADQAALAAATQLDGNGGACERSVAAARELLENQTLMANDGNTSGLAVGIADSDVCQEDTTIIDDEAATIRFFVDKALTDPSEDDSEANFVQVTVDTRRANYALTPVVGAFTSGDLRATAVAGLSTALCKVPPLMVCPPTGTTVDWNAWRGRGIRAVANNGNNWAPGAFGYIGPQDAGSTQKGLAFENPVFQCQSIDGEAPVDTGQPAPAIVAINTRFDMYGMSGGAGNVLTPCLSSACPPALNVTKDYVKADGASCGTRNGHNNSNDAWHLPAANNRFWPRVKNAGDTPMTRIHDTTRSAVPEAMGLPRDNKHYCSYNTGGTCDTNRFGDGVWARGDYFNKYHSGRIPGNAATMTRYETYLWEIENSFFPAPGSGTDKQQSRPVCNMTIPDSTRDRRVLQVAVASNCPSLHGTSTPVQISTWVEMFLVEPGSSPSRGNGDSGNEIYLEVIREVDPGGAAPQVVRRDTPYLIR